jgi:uncharacterized protein (TIGR00251 family)
MIVTAHVKPNAKTDGITAWLDETTAKVSVTAAPEKGKANEAVIRVLASHFRVPPSSIRLVRGASTRLKQFEIPSKNAR